MRYVIIYSFFFIFINSCTVEVAREAAKAIKSIDATIKPEEDIRKKSLYNEESKDIEIQKKLIFKNLIGKNQSQIISMLGKPNLIRQDGKTFLMRFNSQKCIAYTYFKNKDDFSHVSYFELRDINGKLLRSKTEIDNCFDKIINS